MKLEILYFDGCPTYRAAETALSEALRAEGLEARFELVAVNTDEDRPPEARRRQGLGDPLARISARSGFPRTPLTRSSQNFPSTHSAA
jgi:hypothetical protein